MLQLSNYFWESASMHRAMGRNVAGAAQDGAASSQSAGNPESDHGTGSNLASLAAPVQEGSASTSQPQSTSEQSARAAAHLATTEPSGSGAAPVASPRQRSLRNPRSPRSPAAQRRASARSKPDGAEKQSIRRLGAEPAEKKASTDSAAPPPVVSHADDGDHGKSASPDNSNQEPGLGAPEVVDGQHNNSQGPHEKRSRETASPADAASSSGIR